MQIISELRARKKSFVLVELLMVVAIALILMALSIFAFQTFQKESDLTNSAEEVINALRLAQNKTLSSEGGSQWGVYFNTSTMPHQYVLFQGSDYESRVISSDAVYKLPKSVEIYQLLLFSTATSSIVFERITGIASAASSQLVSLRLKKDVSKTKTIYVENSGQIRY